MMRRSHWRRGGGTRLAALAVVLATMGALLLPSTSKQHMFAATAFRPPRTIVSPSSRTVLVHRHPKHQNHRVVLIPIRTVLPAVLSNHKSKWSSSRVRTALHESSSYDPTDGDDDEQQPEDKDRGDASAPSASSSSPSSSSSSSSGKPLDPLFVAVTRMDRETAQAETVKVPLWGELILDRSLFVLLPLAAFAVGGVLLSLYILTHSGDAFVDALAENAVLQSAVPSTNTADPAAACRGLCSSQERDLEGLKAYMSRFAK